MIKLLQARRKKQQKKQSTTQVVLTHMCTYLFYNCLEHRHTCKSDRHMPVHKVASLNKLIHILSKVKIKTILLYCLQYSKAFELHQLLAKHKVTTHKVTTDVIYKQNTAVEVQTGTDK